MKSAISWDIFCRVIDNYGDIGVCWRLALDLASRGCPVRLWVDDARALDWMAPGAVHGAYAGVQVLDWQQMRDAGTVCELSHSDVLLEGFGCEIASEYLAWHFAKPAPRVGAHQLAADWINLEYLSAERYAQAAHGLPSPLLHGVAQGRTRHFYFPGFTRSSGGLIREHGLADQQLAFDARAWLAQFGIAGTTRRMSLFCYEPPALAELLHRLQHDPAPTQLLVTAGRAAAAVRQVLAGHGSASEMQARAQLGSLEIRFLPELSQTGFDRLLWSCDLNFVRGEDSLVRAIWANKPFVWQIYPQDGGAHHGKLLAVLDALQASASWHKFHLAWNHLATPLPTLEHTNWHNAVLNAHTKLLEQSDLTTRLIEFVVGAVPGVLRPTETR